MGIQGRLANPAAPSCTVLGCGEIPLVETLDQFSKRRHPEKANPASSLLAGSMVELSGVEPLTS